MLSAELAPQEAALVNRKFPASRGIPTGIIQTDVLQGSPFLAAHSLLLSTLATLLPFTPVPQALVLEQVEAALVEVEAAAEVQPQSLLASLRLPPPPLER